MALKDKGGFLVDDSVWQGMKKNLLKGQHLATKVGFFEEDTYGEENDYLPVAQVAQWNNEGHRNGGIFNGTVTPSRPFFYMYMDMLRKDGKLVKEMASYIHLVAMGRMTWTAFYNILGEEAKEDLKKVIEQWMYPPNSPITVDLKGFNDPLVETGFMKDSVKHKLGKKTD